MSVFKHIRNLFIQFRGREGVAGLSPSIATTLGRIRGSEPRADAWRKLITYLGPDYGEDKPVSFLRLIESNGLGEALDWCRTVPEAAQEWWTLMLLYAQHVELIANDKRLREAIINARSAVPFLFGGEFRDGAIELLESAKTKVVSVMNDLEVTSSLAFENAQARCAALHSVSTRWQDYRAREDAQDALLAADAASDAAVAAQAAADVARMAIIGNLRDIRSIAGKAAYAAGLAKEADVKRKCIEGVRAARLSSRAAQAVGYEDEESIGIIPENEIKAAEDMERKAEVDLERADEKLRNAEEAGDRARASEEAWQSAMLIRITERLGLRLGDERLS